MLIDVPLRASAAAPARRDLAGPGQMRVVGS
jgi:hypothetical protein